MACGFEWVSSSVQREKHCERREVHVGQMRAHYADSSLVVGTELQGLFEMTKHQGEYEI